MSAAGAFDTLRGGDSTKVRKCRAPQGPALNSVLLPLNYTTPGNTSVKGDFFTRRNISPDLWQE